MGHAGHVPPRQEKVHIGGNRAQLYQLRDLCSPFVEMSDEVYNEGQGLLDWMVGRICVVQG